MRILITGACGFIGSNLVKEALKAGYEVTALDDLSTGSVANLHGLDVELIEGQVQDPAAVARSLRSVERVVHLGALPSVPRSIKAPLASHAANATGTLVLLEEARRANVQHVSVASSSSVYGANPAMPKSEREWVRPMSPYAVSKLATEQYALAYQSSYDMATAAFRFFNVFGPGQPAGHDYAAVVPAFIDALLAGRPLQVNGDGEQSRDFTFVGTVCRALLAATTRAVSHPEPVNLAFGTNTTLNQLVSELESLTGLTAAIDRNPPRQGDVRHSQADNASLQALFPEVQPVSLVDGLRETIAWFERGLGPDALSRSVGPSHATTK